MNQFTHEKKLSDSFQMAAGGIACFVSACFNSIMRRVRPGSDPQRDKGSFFGDLMGPE